MMENYMERQLMEVLITGVLFFRMILLLLFIKNYLIFLTAHLLMVQVLYKLLMENYMVQRKVGETILLVLFFHSIPLLHFIKSCLILVMITALLLMEA